MNNNNNGKSIIFQEKSKRAMRMIITLFIIESKNTTRVLISIHRQGIQFTRLCSKTAVSLQRNTAAAVDAQRSITRYLVHGCREKTK